SATKPCQAYTLKRTNSELSTAEMVVSKPVQGQRRSGRVQNFEARAVGAMADSGDRHAKGGRIGEEGLFKFRRNGRENLIIVPAGNERGEREGPGACELSSGRGKRKR